MHEQNHKMSLLTTKYGIAREPTG